MEWFFVYFEEQTSFLLLCDEHEWEWVKDECRNCIWMQPSYYLRSTIPQVWISIINGLRDALDQTKLIPPCLDFNQTPEPYELISAGLLQKPSIRYFRSNPTNLLLDGTIPSIRPGSFSSIILNPWSHFSLLHFKHARLLFGKWVLLLLFFFMSKVLFYFLFTTKYRGVLKISVL